MVRLRTVEEAQAHDEGSRFLESLSDTDLIPRFKTNSLGPSAKNVSDEDIEALDRLIIGE